MPAGVAPAGHEPARRNVGAAVLELEVHGRWDALALSELLIPFHSFLVQHAGERWAVHARCPGCRGESLDDALAAIGAWQAERGVEAVVRVDGRALGPRR